jgi:hypothetical protein
MESIEKDEKRIENSSAGKTRQNNPTSLLPAATYLHLCNTNNLRLAGGKESAGSMCECYPVPS